MPGESVFGGSTRAGMPVFVFGFVELEMEQGEAHPAALHILR